MRSILRSLLAILAGYIAPALLTLVTVPILGALAPATLDAGNGWSVWLNVAYGAVFAAAGGWLAARLAPSKPFVHAIILAVLMGVLTGLTAVAAASAPPTPEYNQPAWYYPVLAGVSVLAVTFGGWLYSRKK